MRSITKYKISSFIGVLQSCSLCEYSSASVMASMYLMLLRRMSRRLSLLAHVSRGCSGRAARRRLNALSEENSLFNFYLFHFLDFTSLKKKSSVTKILVFSVFLHEKQTVCFCVNCRLLLNSIRIIGFDLNHKINPLFKQSCARGL